MNLESRESFPSHEYPSPVTVLEAALALITGNGSVDDIDEEGVVFQWDPEEPVALGSLPSDVYEYHLLNVAKAIYGAASQVASWPEETERRVRNLAIYLRPYFHGQDFLRQAVALGEVDERGFVRPPHLFLFCRTE